MKAKKNEQLAHQILTTDDKMLNLYLSYYTTTVFEILIYWKLDFIEQTLYRKKLANTIRREKILKPGITQATLGKYTARIC